MNLIRSLFDQTESSDLSFELGNMIVSGVDHAGTDKVFREVLNLCLDERKTVIFLNGKTSDESYRRTVDYIDACIGTEYTYVFSYGAESNRVDILSAFSSANEKGEFLANLIRRSSRVSDTQYAFIKRFYTLVFRILDAADEVYKLDRLVYFDPDYLLSRLESCSMTEMEKVRQERFLKDRKTREAFLELDTYMADLEDKGLLELFSGDLLMDDVLADGNVVFIRVGLREDTEKGNLLLNVLLDAIEKKLERTTGESDLVFLSRNADQVSGDLYEKAFTFNESYRCSSYLFLEDIAGFVEKSGDSIFSQVKSCIVMQQLSPKCAEFWASFFGDTWKPNQIAGTGRSFFPVLGAGGVVDSTKHHGFGGDGIKVEKTLMYEPGAFQKLRENEAFIYLRGPRVQRRKKYLEV